jgi:prepilin-type N-terminal cleavage/methylation domain-containing protein
MISPRTKLYFLQLQASHKKADKGFTMVEVMVGILLTLVFTTIAMQAMVTATSIKVRSQELSDSDNWIQQDLETVKTASNALNYDDANDTYPISSAAIEHANRCAAITSTSTVTASANGYAALLKTNIDAVTIPTKLSPIGNRQYTLTRTTVASSTSPFNVLQITYRVYRGTDTTATPIANLYTEVVPGASLYCRQTPSS